MNTIGSDLEPDTVLLTALGKQCIRSQRMASFIGLDHSFILFDVSTVFPQVISFSAHSETRCLKDPAQQHLNEPILLGRLFREDLARIDSIGPQRRKRLKPPHRCAGPPTINQVDDVDMRSLQRLEYRSQPLQSPLKYASSDLFALRDGRRDRIDTDFGA